MCGSGTTIDVAKELRRKVIGYDISPYRKDIIQNDARKSFYYAKNKTGGPVRPYLVEVKDFETQGSIIVDMEGPYHPKNKRISEHI